MSDELIKKVQDAMFDAEREHYTAASRVSNVAVAAAIPLIEANLRESIATEIEAMNTVLLHHDGTGAPDGMPTVIYYPADEVRTHAATIARGEKR